MKIYSTSKLLENLYQQTEEFLQQAISKWQMTGLELLLKQPGEKKWSAAQCLEHLNSYGRYYLPAIEKAIEAAKSKGALPDATFKPGLLGNYFTKVMLPKEGGKQMKMRSPKDHRPVAELDASKVVSEFIDQQEKLLLLLEKAKEVDLNRVKVSISIAQFIKLQLGDVFMFVIAHNHRHVVQAERAIATALTLKKEDAALP